MNLTPDAIAFHRNGVLGAPFHVVLFRDEGPAADPKVAVVFDSPGHAAVLDLAQLLGGDVAFGSNSWQGDAYEPSLRQLVNAHEAARSAAADEEFDGA